MKCKISSALLFITVLLSSVFISCKEDKSEFLHFENVKMTVGDTYEIPDGENFTWECDDTIAEIDGHKIFAKEVGYTQVYTNSKGFYSFDLYIFPVQLFEQPCMEWGATINTVKEYMGDRNILLETDSCIVYDKSHKELWTCYEFKNGKLDYAEINIAMQDITMDEYINFFNYEYYYQFINENKNIMYYVTKDHNTLIATRFTTLENIDIINVMFMQYQ